MTRVRKVEIEEVEEKSKINKMFESLVELENLDYVLLRGFRFRSMPSLDGIRSLRSLTKLKLEGRLSTLPSADNFPPNITHLALVNTSLDQDPMPVLQNLPNLVHLKLRNACTGKGMTIGQGGLPMLQVLCIGELWHLRSLRVGEGAMPKLKVLEIKHCPYLEKFPEEMTYNLSELKMLTTKSIASEINKLGLSSRIRHVHLQP